MGRRQGERAQNKECWVAMSHLPKLFFPSLPPLTSLAWKRKVKARVEMVRSQIHRFVSHLDQGSISKPHAHDCEPTKLPLQTNFVPSKVSPTFATQPSGREREEKKKKSKGSNFFFFNLMVCFLPVSRPLLSLWGGPQETATPGPVLCLTLPSD